MGVGSKVPALKMYRIWVPEPELSRRDGVAVASWTEGGPIARGGGALCVIAATVGKRGFCRLKNMLYAAT